MIKRYVLVTDDDYDVTGVYYGGRNKKYSDVINLTIRDHATLYPSKDEAQAVCDAYNSAGWHWKVEEYPIIKMPIGSKWFNMILSGEKPEEYRDIKPYWTTRLKNAGYLDSHSNPVEQELLVLLTNGYGGNDPAILIKANLKIGPGNPDWGGNAYTLYYTLEILKIVEKFNL